MDIRKILQTLDNLESKKVINESFKDQVKGTEKAKKKTNDEHPFVGRLVGEAPKRNQDQDVAEGPLDNVDPDEIISMIDNELEMGNHYEGAVISVSDELDMDPSEVDNIYRKNTPDSDAIPPIDFGLDQDVVEDLAESLKKEYQLYLESIKQYPKYNGLEGPFTMRSGKTVYYEESTGTYIDADSEKLNEYGPVGASATTTAPGGNNNPQQKTGTGTTTNLQDKDNQNTSNTQQQQQQQQQNKTTPGQQPTEPAEVGPQDIAMGFLKGMGINNPGKQQVDALAKSLAQNLRKAP